MAAPLPPPYAPVGGFVGVTDAPDQYETHFSRFDTLKTIKLPNGYEAVPIWQIQRQVKRDSREETARANLLNNWWLPKKQQQINWPSAQRCPFVSVDNACFFFNRDMYDKGIEPHLILGLWDKKDVEIFGHKQHVKGLVLAAGGHYERMANKIARPGKWETIGVQFEQGDMTLREAADKELSEEIGIDRKTSRIITRELGFMDDPLAEPRAHYLRCIYLRWIEQAPKTSAELKKALAVPVSRVKDLCARKTVWKDANGNEFGLELNHDLLIGLILSHPDTNAFLANISTVYDRPLGSQADTGGLSAMEFK